ncbi:MAG: Unknown protein [uncultured Sulfurovum sp.]|uniref:Uncharacterized protein n=1 Tax=uncultured Sulfurovum sp. TaxID=269237 RepID=A0A6S6SWR0_9BACT|nr:MAG: Unknown protein [uncultured Sulfurovum sp.]
MSKFMKLVERIDLRHMKGYTLRRFIKKYKEDILAYTKMNDEVFSSRTPHQQKIDILWQLSLSKLNNGYKSI